MDIRSQISMVFHLDKCIGCHTCSVACKNIWTDRKGTEYMWWNNVETKPGTGFPTRWEDQDKYKGGWELVDGELKLKSTNKTKTITNIFHNPDMPTMDDYYEPWSYKYKDLFDAPAGDDQPTAKPISMVTGEYMDIEAGPNWDDDLSGSPIYAENDINLDSLSDEQRDQLFAIERLMMFYFPRICNHCVNPSCVASCPSGALYKRGEDGIVLIDQERCRAWRSCITACPYKKTYYNWNTGKSEKCILCFPRLETGQAPACFHSCVGRIRYLGVLLYDADKIEETAKHADHELIDAQREMILDPFDKNVIREAKKNGIADSTIKAAQNSPVYKFVKDWGIALPPHPEYRTLPMLFYVPPMLPVMSAQEGDSVRSINEEYFPDFEKARVPIKYLASMFGGGNESHLRYVLKKQSAIRAYRRSVTVGDIDMLDAEKALLEADCNPEEADKIYKLTSLCTFDDRFVIPAAHREEAIEMMKDPLEHKQEVGFGFREAPARGN
ncbi:MAG: nitrate reductase subunit beta [Candidatus Marinimicrobia bacterium]|jgi:nitrate reductase / nitrite oxidoreductase, beta subunit|nr:nitrate reductase subunit beta [Candidatus Neomarinimicrobiota bacterium]MBT3847957.1 nitrate reductase subunit beta [Candidatus Neomarinimicrobiota bacterium]MBT5114478.1 nitrate reductase subunit beta [Candidatus Neomarinimicrobiota bacterium]MBT6130555.1 nitrate reductase subunit beta [Candidatus Neomarinimicrobiota bacterium]MBT6413840.1 nitrate reductase subunit beta [Candidatus Neomarinimicrobiota bacterium]